MAYIIAAPASANRQQLKSLKPLLKRLRELGVKRIIAPPHDPIGQWFGQKLRVIPEQYHGLIPWRQGKDPNAKAPADPTVPVPGGDSRASYAKRVEASREKLEHTPDALYVSTREHWRAVLDTDLSEGRVYQV